MRRSATGNYKWRTCPRSLRVCQCGIRPCELLDMRLQTYHWVTTPHAVTKAPNDFFSKCRFMQLCLQDIHPMPYDLWCIAMSNCIPAKDCLEYFDEYCLWMLACPSGGSCCLHCLLQSKQLGKMLQPWVQIPGGYSPSKNLSWGSKYCISPTRKCWNSLPPLK